LQTVRVLGALCGAKLQCYIIMTKLFEHLQAGAKKPALVFAEITAEQAVCREPEEQPDLAFVDI
ncbi:hypothetical protein C7N43_37150, partial [Sphingobacteriales bacterium UPWRP_1]